MKQQEFNRKMEEVYNLISLVDRSLKENCKGFLTLYTEKIKSISFPFTEAYIRREILMTEEERVKEEQDKQRGIIFWNSVEYYLKTSPEFKRCFHEILKPLFLETSPASKDIQNKTQVSLSGEEKIE